MHRQDILDAVTDHVLKAVKRLDRKRYAQESAYVDAFLGRLDGVINFGKDYGTIDIKSTIVADRGPGAAEHKFGADFALTFESTGIPSPLKKAILGQAKNGDISKLGTSEALRLTGQCKKMASVTRSYVVLEAPLEPDAIPNIRLGNYKNYNWKIKSIPFPEYLVDQVVACHHGDTNPVFINAVADSKLSQIKITTKGLEYEPDPPTSTLKMGM